MPLGIVCNAGDALAPSPKTARKNIDDSVSVTLIGKIGSSYVFTLANIWGSVLYQTRVDQPQARSPITNLAPGTYQVIADNGDNTWSQDIDFLYERGPYLLVTPNPAKVRSTATLQDPLCADCNITWRIVNQTGAPLRNGVAVCTTWAIALEGLPPGQHTILVSDGYLEYNKLDNHTAMKALTIVSIAALLQLALSSCHKDTAMPDPLPAATQTGKATFGCLLNGRPFVSDCGGGYCVYNSASVHPVFDSLMYAFSSKNKLFNNPDTLSVKRNEHISIFGYDI